MCHKGAPSQHLQEAGICACLSMVATTTGIEINASQYVAGLKADQKVLSQHYQLHCSSPPAASSVHQVG